MIYLLCIYDPLISVIRTVYLLYVMCTCVYIVVMEFCDMYLFPYKGLVNLLSSKMYIFSKFFNTKTHFKYKIV